MMAMNTILSSLSRSRPDTDDMIILNGGEPTIHPNFYALLRELQTRFPSEIVVYTNGIALNPSKLQRAQNTFFVIPIHGLEAEHDNITQTVGSFQHTIRKLHLFNQNGVRYKIKFILNETMVSKGFQIKKFLAVHRLTPEEIMIARLNRTKKSEINHVLLPQEKDLITYIRDQVAKLKTDYKIKFLDIPPCWVCGADRIAEKENEIPKFYFNDPNNEMQSRSYYKEVMMGSNCNACEWRQACSVMKNSYLTLSLHREDFQLERE